MASIEQIPFNDLSRIPNDLLAQIQSAVSDVVASGWFVMGPEHNALELELSAYVGVKHAINVANGTDALQLGLAALGVSAGDLVVTVANAGGYTSVAARLLGAVPAYCDVDEQTHLMSPVSLRTCLEELSKKPAAIVVTHLYGALAPVADIYAVAQEYEIPLLEDCAQSLGASVNSKRGGSLAEIATTSFYPTKNLGAVGDAGAVFTNSDELAQKVKTMRQYGWNGKYNMEFNSGQNSRLDELQAAVLRIKLPLLDSWNQRRREIHSRYEAASNGEVTFVNTSTESFVGHLAVVTSPNRTQLLKFFSDRGIKTEIHYPIADHQQLLPAPFERSQDLSVTERLTTEIFSLPLFPELTDSEVDRICDALTEVP
jgi:dTDP-4-amino-4,6-dideoxygalactose transaminase